VSSITDVIIWLEPDDEGLIWEDGGTSSEDEIGITVEIICCTYFPAYSESWAV
jgi:hypothetical protein